MCTENVCVSVKPNKARDATRSKPCISSTQSYKMQLLAASLRNVLVSRCTKHKKAWTIAEAFEKRGKEKEVPKSNQNSRIKNKFMFYCHQFIPSKKILSVDTLLACKSYTHTHCSKQHKSKRKLWKIKCFFVLFFRDVFIWFQMDCIHLEIFCRCYIVIAALQSVAVQYNLTYGSKQYPFRLLLSFSLSLVKHTH